MLAARADEALQQVAQQCRARGGQAVALPTDVGDPDAVDELARRAVEAFGRIDVWVNAAAVHLFAPFTEVALDDLRRVWQINLLGQVHGARAALPITREQGQGVLVNVSSIAGACPQPYTHLYAMTKSAIRTLSASLRQELQLDGARGVKVCTVLPATIDPLLFEHAADYTGRQISSPCLRCTHRSGWRTPW